MSFPFAKSVMPSSKGTQVFSINNRDFYDVKKTWELTKNIPWHERSVNSLAWQLYDPHWDNGLTAMEVLRNPERYPEHRDRIRKANLMYPILLLDGIVVDGMHRLAKAYMLRLELIRAIDVPSALLKDVWLFREEPLRG